MIDLKVIEGRRYHCGRMSRLLRGAHLEALARTGLSVHHSLRRTFDGSYFRRAILIDGELAALGGVEGDWLATSGFVWLTLTRRAVLHPLPVVRAIHGILDEMMENKVELHTAILDGDEAAVRFAAFLGFQVEGFGPGSRVYSMAGRRRFVRYVQDNPDLHHAIGNGTAVPFIYKPERACDARVQ